MPPKIIEFDTATLHIDGVEMGNIERVSLIELEPKEDDE